MPVLERLKSCTWNSPFTLFLGGLIFGEGLIFGGKFVVVIRGAYILGRAFIRVWHIFGILRYFILLRFNLTINSDFQNKGHQRDVTFSIDDFDFVDK